MASEHEPEDMVEAAEELQRRVEELRDHAAAWEESLRAETRDAVPGTTPPSPDLPVANALHAALSSLTGSIKSGLRAYEQQRPKGDLTAFKKWIETRAG
jgi:hypothetical protein